MQIGSRVRIEDQACFYVGRMAVVEDIAKYGEVTVLTVAIGNITMAVRADKVVVL